MSKDFKLAKSLSRRSFMKSIGVAASVAAMPGALRVLGQDEAPEFVDIGAVVPLTGALASFGPRFEVASRLAVDNFNAARGSFPGPRVNLLVRDSGTDPDTGVAAATDLINNVGVPVIFGAAASGVTIPITSATIANGVFQISPSATSPAISNLDDNDLVFRTAPPDSLQGIVLADLAFNQQGFSSIAIIARNDAYGEGLALSLQDNFEALGGTVTAVSLYDPNTTDFSAEIAEASADSPDAISLITFDEGEQLIIQMVQAGVTNFNLFVDGNKNQDLITRIADAVGADVLSGIVGTAPAVAETAGGDLFAQLYRDRLGEDPFVFTPHSYDALALVSLVIDFWFCLFGTRVCVGADFARLVRLVANPGGPVVGVNEFETALQLVNEAGNELGAPLDPSQLDDDGLVAELAQILQYSGASGDVDLDENGDPFGPVGTWTIDDSGTIQEVTTVECGFDEDGTAFCDPIGG